MHANHHQEDLLFLGAFGVIAALSMLFLFATWRIDVLMSILPALLTGIGLLWIFIVAQQKGSWSYFLYGAGALLLIFIIAAFFV